MATKKVAINPKQLIAQYQKQFKVPFEMKDDAIDLREMGKNYANGIIPLEDVQQAVKTVLKPGSIANVLPYDPSGGATITYPTVSVSPRFAYVDWKDLYLWPIFQRDVAPNHVLKIKRDFDHTAVIVPCAIKVTLENGQVIYCIWDGHHTTQVCRMMGYTKFPVWFIDVDHIPAATIEAAGFQNTDADRIAYGAYIAGTNMRRINGKNKRPLSPYDDFMIGIETRDEQCVAMNNILKKHSCRARRHSTAAGDFSQIKSGIECFELADDNGVKGRYWDRAIAFHRKYWPGAPLELELFRPMSYLFQLSELQNGVGSLPAKFDEDLAKLLIKKYGSAESIQVEIKASFTKTLSSVGIRNAPIDGKFNVLCGIISLCNKHLKSYQMPVGDYHWVV
jgi:hypothetical protein